MSKMDGLRAMREARYERAAELAAKGGARARSVPRPAPAAEPPAPATEPEAQESPRCGHRNMSGRTCTREQGHSARSHRYS
ncbi:MAG TPA: hypothetical protein VFO98_01935 [Marmoricola sp.]|jgi:hypothetical protein|nr:hypothetical protein [Marmoricola sp.]